MYYFLFRSELYKKKKNHSRKLRKYLHDENATVFNKLLLLINITDNEHDSRRVYTSVLKNANTPGINDVPIRS